MPRNERTPPRETEPDVIFCAECGEPMARGTAKTDPNGQPVSEECYLCKLRKQQGTKLPEKPQTSWPTRFGVGRTN